MKAGRIWVGIVVSMLFAGAGSLHAASLQISKMYIDDETLYMSFISSVTDAINIVSIVNDGINIEFKYTICVYRNMGILLPSELLVKRTVLISAKKDFINDGYEIMLLDGSAKRYLWISGIPKLYDTLMKVNGIFLVDLSQLDERSDYYAEVQLQVTSLKLYPPLSIIYNLFGNWNYTSRKIRSRMFNKDGFAAE